MNRSSVFILIGCLAFLMGCLIFGIATHIPSDLLLAEKQKTAYTIVYSDKASESEKYAAQELALYLSKICSATFPLAAESAGIPNERRIFVGPTLFSDKNGMAGSNLGREEWLIKTIGNDLVIAGGRPRGTLYGVYEFLEKYAGCHWLDPNTEIIPSKVHFSLPRLDIKGQPAFIMREIFGYLGERRNADGDRKTNFYRFLARNKSNGASSASDLSIARFGLNDRFGSPSGCHTFGYYINPKEYYASHPEYFSQNAKGIRDKGGEDHINTKFQLCLSNPEVRKIVLTKLKNNIASDRKKCDRDGTPYPLIYDISQNDDTTYICLCPACKAISEREGSEAGLLVDFINEIADGIKKDYPDILVQTFAYVPTENPPKLIKPRDNVLVRMTDMYFYSDPTRPLSHPVNAECGNAKKIEKWGSISTNLGIWDYWRSFTSGRHEDNPPYHNISSMQPDLQFFWKCKAKTFFAEAEDYFPYPNRKLDSLAPMPSEFQSFYALKIWLGYKLLQNPMQDIAPLLNTFFAGYYGPGAQDMLEYFNYLSTRQDASPNNLAKGFSPHFDFLDLAFFLQAEKCFNAAEKKTTGPRERFHILLERIPVDNALMNCWEAIEKEAAGKHIPLPFTYESVLERYRQSRIAYARETFPDANQQKIALEDVAEHLLHFHREDFSIPDELREFSKSSMKYFGWRAFDPQHVKYNKLMDDKEAAGGKAMVYVGDGSEKAHDKNAVIYGASSVTTKSSLIKTMSTSGIPPDEKYHLYYIGKITITANTYIFASWRWTIQCPVSNLFDPASSDNDWDAFISMKITGPAYILTSTNINAIWVDKVMLVKPQKGAVIRTAHPTTK